MAEYIAEKLLPISTDEPAQKNENPTPPIPFDMVFTPKPEPEDPAFPRHPLIDFGDRRPFLYVQEELRKFPVHVYWDREGRKFISAYSVPSKEDRSQKKIFILNEISLSPIQARVFNHLLDHGAKSDEGLSTQSIAESLVEEWAESEKPSPTVFARAIHDVMTILKRQVFKSQQKVVLVRSDAPKGESHLSKLEKQKVPRTLYNIKTNKEAFTDGTWPEDQSVEYFADVPER